MTITQADFVELLPFSNKIEAQQINAFITQARQLDLLPLLGHETLEAVDRLVAPVVLPESDALTLVVTGQCYERRGRVYRALSATTEPIPVLSAASYTASLAPGHIANPPAEGQWQYERLLTLWQVYLRAYWVQRAFARFTPSHGVNITKAGLTTTVDATTNTRPSRGQVATLQAGIDNTAEARLSALTRFLRYEGLLWFIDAQGIGGYSVDGYRHYSYDDHAYTGGSCGSTRRHRRPIRGINR